MKDYSFAKKLLSILHAIHQIYDNPLILLDNKRLSEGTLCYNKTENSRCREKEHYFINLCHLPRHIKQLQKASLLENK